MYSQDFFGSDIVCVSDNDILYIYMSRHDISSVQLRVVYA